MAYTVIGTEKSGVDFFHACEMEKIRRVVRRDFGLEAL